MVLFGSRVDDSLRGGDIDLYIIPEKKLTADQLYKERIYFLSALKMKIGDQKIDLIIARDQNRPIEREALKNGVVL